MRDLNGFPSFNQDAGSGWPSTFSPVSSEQFTANGNFTVPPSGKIWVTLVGPGGASGTTETSYTAGGGASGVHWINKPMRLPAGLAVPVSISTNGVTFGAYLSAPVGMAGEESNNYSTIVVPGGKAAKSSDPCFWQCGGQDGNSNDTYAYNGAGGTGLFAGYGGGGAGQTAGEPGMAIIYW